MKIYLQISLHIKYTWWYLHTTAFLISSSMYRMEPFNWRLVTNSLLSFVGRVGAGDCNFCGLMNIAVLLTCMFWSLPHIPSPPTTITPPPFNLPLKNKHTFQTRYVPKTINQDLKIPHIPLSVLGKAWFSHGIFAPICGRIGPLLQTASPEAFFNLTQSVF